MSDVKQKVAIVTGAASGLGFAAAQKLMDEGAKVFLTDINEKVINTMPERLANYSETQFHTIVHDVANEDSWINVIEKAENHFGKINILVNSAGISLGADVVSTDFEIWKKDEECLGIIFTYFMLETILLGKLMKLNPFDQPAVESIKKETKKYLVRFSPKNKSR